jgi:hypothetical protein
LQDEENEKSVNNTEKNVLNPIYNIASAAINNTARTSFSTAKQKTFDSVSAQKENNTQNPDL